MNKKDKEEREIPFSYVIRNNLTFCKDVDLYGIKGQSGVVCLSNVKRDQKLSVLLESNKNVVRKSNLFVFLTYSGVWGPLLKFV